jgi:hypothetical protein
VFRFGVLRMICSAVVLLCVQFVSCVRVCHIDTVVLRCFPSRVVVRCCVALGAIVVYAWPSE